MSIEDFVPTLSRGSHDSPEEGACVMEMVSFLAGEEWSDMPECTSDYISLLAQSINDSVETRNRPLILKDFDRLFNTNIPTNRYSEFTDKVAERLGGIHAGPKVKELTRGKLSAYFNVRDNVVNEFEKIFPVQDALDFEMLEVLTIVLDVYDEMFRPDPAPKQDMYKLKDLFVS